jgi:hypothetical protein
MNYQPPQSRIPTARRLTKHCSAGSILMRQRPARSGTLLDEAIRRVGLVVIDRVGEGGKLVFEDVIEFRQRIMHSGRSHALSEPDLLSRKVKQLRDAAFVVAYKRERVWNRTLKRHVKKDSVDGAVGKEAK